MKMEDGTELWTRKENSIHLEIVMEKWQKYDVNVKEIKFLCSTVFHKSDEEAFSRHQNKHR